MSDELADEDAFHVPIEDAIDLHPFSPRDVLSVIGEYLNATHEAGFEVVRLIHGRGKGVQRASVHQFLASHPLVADFWDAPETRLGATLVRLKRTSRPRDLEREP